MSESNKHIPKAKSQSPLTRSISVESIAPKLSSFFGKRKRKIHNDTSDSNHESEDGSDTDASTLIEHDLKKRKILDEEHQKFLENEKKLDDELPEDLRKFRPRGFKFNLPPTDRPIRIYADGVFDLFHLGHMKQLEQAKKAFPNTQLVCGIPSDIETHKRKGLTVLTDQQRCDTLMHCKWVDEVIPNAPWCVTPEFLLKHKIDYVAHDDLPYASSDSDDIYKPIKEMGMFLTTQRTEGISTSDIITKIIRDYDKYLMRNFARGATRKDLNVSWLKKNELDLKKHISDFRTYWVKNTTNFNNVSKDLYIEVREFLRGKKSDFHLSDFLSISDSDDHDTRPIPSPRLKKLKNDGNLSPMAEFAAKYIGNANKELNGKSIFANVTNWIKRDDLNDDDSSTHESDTTLITNKSPRRAVKNLKDLESLKTRKLKVPVSRKKLN